jgi:hypothetical protein
MQPKSKMRSLASLDELSVRIPCMVCYDKNTGLIVSILYLDNVSDGASKRLGKIRPGLVHKYNMWFVVTRTTHTDRALPSSRTTFKSHASQTAEKQDDFEIEENHIFEVSALYTTSYDEKCVSLDSLYPTLYFETRYTRYHILASAQTVETYLTESNL